MIEHIKKIHFVGVGGIGMSALALLMHEQGKAVSGSDLTPSLITERLQKNGIKIFSGHGAENVSEGVQLVVYTSATPEDNVERDRARELGITEWSYGEMLGAVSREYSTIAVCGTHGKSTTTAMLGLILEAGGYDPTVLVGSLVPGLKHGNLRVGKGRFFVVEACEYKAQMLNIDPEMIVITNIEEDHLDYYRNLDHIRETFQTFVNKLSSKGLAVYNADDAESRTLKFGHAVGYASKGQTDYTAAGNIVSRKEDGKLGELALKVPGAHNVMNALAATAAAMELGVPFEACKRALESFGGIWRRIETIGEWKGATVISDYAHHPTEIDATLAAVREKYPARRLVLCYQPHQHDRTKKFFDGFVKSLAVADVLVLAEIYGVAGRTDSIPPLPE